jgi:hypothetical protein
VIYWALSPDRKHSTFTMLVSLCGNENLISMTAVVSMRFCSWEFQMKPIVVQFSTLQDTLDRRQALILHHVSRWEQISDTVSLWNSFKLREAIVSLYVKVRDFLVSSTGWMKQPFLHSAYNILGKVLLVFLFQVGASFK